MPAGNDALDQGIERLVRKAGSFDHAVSLLRLGKAGDGGIHMVVECEQVNSSVREPLSDPGFSIEIEGLVAQMEAGIRRQLRPQCLDRLEQLPGIVRAPQPGLPRPRCSVKDRRYAIGDRLAVAVDQRHIHGKINAGTWHHLPLEGIAVQIDDSRQYLQTVCIDGNRASCLLRAHGDNVAACYAQRGLMKFAAEKGPAAFDR
jgi:hypothetical protein